MRQAAILAGAIVLAACSAEKPAEKMAETGQAAVSLKPSVIHDADPMRGRTTFIDKGCVLCHSVNGVGGKAAPALDAEIGAPAVDPLEFAARMWRGAPAMIELQAIELGYTIYLTADDLADLAAFAADRDAQKSLKIDDLPETIRNGLLDERFWETENWDQFLRDGQESEFPEEDETTPGEPQ
jgi:cytochrome c